jgi:tetratricopeptide (TPR) repeat protein
MTLLVKIIRYFFILLSLYNVSFSQTDKTDWTYVHNTTRQGIDALYNLDFDKSQEKFDELMNTIPGDPRGYFFSAIRYFFQYMIYNDQEDSKKFFELSEKVISICENLIKQNKRDYNAQFFLGGIYGYRGLAHMLNQSIVKAVWDGRKGYNLIKDIIKEQPNLYDAYLGSGLFDYLLSKTPKSYSWVLNVLGYSGDLETGFKHLKIAESKGTYTQQEARFYLAQFLFFEKKYDEAFFYIKKLIKEYPDNTLFLVAYADMEIKIDKPENAINPCKQAIEINNRRKVKFIDAQPYVVLANAYYFLNDFKLASDNYELYLQKASKVSTQRLRNLTFFYMGISHEFSGKRDKAIEVYKLIKQNNQNRQSYESRFYNRMMEFIDHPPNPAYKNVVMGKNLLSRQKNEIGEKELLFALSSGSLNDNEKAECCYSLAEYYYNNKNYDDAENYFLMVSKTKPTTEKHLVPYSYFSLGKVMLQKEDFEKAKNYFNIAKTYEDYISRDRLQDSIKLYMKKIK